MQVASTLWPLYILYIYPLGCILVSCATLLRYNTLGPFLINLINGICNLILGVALCDLCLSGSRLVKNWFFYKHGLGGQHGA